MEAILDGEEDGKTDDGKSFTEENEGVAKEGPVGEVGCDETESERRGDWWDGMQLGLYGAVMQGFDDRRGKVGE